MVKYIKERNEILKKYLGLPFDLVPEEQIKEFEPIRLNILEDCPYCYHFYTNDNCEGCPMYEADNACNSSENNTWSNYIDYCNSKYIPKHWRKDSPAFKPVQEAIRRYNTRHFKGINK